MHPDQADLFAEAPLPPDPDWLDRLRRELAALLAQARGAERLPWDPSGAMLAEMRFESLSSRLPEAEGEALRAAFGVELDRLYAAV